MRVTVRDWPIGVQREGSGIVRVHVLGTVPEDRYADAIYACDEIVRVLRPFARSFNTWGCDGIGYVIERGHGRAFRNVSTIGPRLYVKAEAAIREYAEREAAR